MSIGSKFNRRRLKDKELRVIKFETTESWLSKGNKVSILSPYKPEMKVYVGNIRKVHSRGSTK